LQTIDATDPKQSSTARHEVTAQVGTVLRVVSGENSREEIQQRLHLQHRESFRLLYLQPALAAGLIERTIPEKPRNPRAACKNTASPKKAALGSPNTHTEYLSTRLPQVLPPDRPQLCELLTVQRPCGTPRSRPGRTRRNQVRFPENPAARASQDHGRFFCALADRDEPGISFGMKSRFPPFLESDSPGGNFRVFYKAFGQAACHPEERYVKESWQDDLLR
jgi:ATP-dependent DNA helicase RecG